jgi:hypothetical protein
VVLVVVVEVMVMHINIEVLELQDRVMQVEQIIKLHLILDEEVVVLVELVLMV